MTTFLDHASHLPSDPSVDTLVGTPVPSESAIPRDSAAATPADTDLAAIGGDATPATSVGVIAGTDAAASPDDEADPKADADDGLDIEDSTRLYLREISRVALLTAEEEVMLAKTMEIGIRTSSDPALALSLIHI